MPMILAAHKVPYVATASIAYPQDLINKTARARDTKGFCYIHIQAPCPTGWRFPDNKTIEVARMAVETGMWQLYEVENGGRKKLTYKPEQRRPVTDYFGIQGRFRNLKKGELAQMQEETDRQCREYAF
jgi:pyruvate ferredoxin oxidoreductase beta subunit